MSYIEMCGNQECSLKEKCYRFTAIPSKDHQAYNYFKPDEEGQCDYYWDNKGYKDEHKDRDDD